MIKSELHKYKINGSFCFDFSKPYREVCNAPKDKSGIYLIYKVENDTESLIYIGSSGQRDKNGELKTRNGGMYDRLINGYHPNRFGEEKRIKRNVSFPKQMQKENISIIKIYWWLTYDNVNSHFPTDIETELRIKYLAENQNLPSWHQQK